MAEAIEQAQWIALDTLKLWTRNYNQGDVGAISNSIKRFGFNKSVRAWNGVVMAGNHSIKALRQLQADGWQPSGGGLRVIDGDWYVSVIDVSHLSEQEAEAFAIADNRTAELASHDDVALAELLQEMALADMALMRDAGYDGDDLDQLLYQLNPTFDPNAEWVGMPEFEQDAVNAYHTIKVHFNSEDDINNFAALLGQTVTNKTTSIHYPKQEREDQKKYRVINES